MASVLSLESQARKLEDWAVYLEDCKRCVWSDCTKAHPHIGVEVRPPDINLSETDFAVVFADGDPADALHGHVRFGLQAIAGAGEAAARAAVAQRKKDGLYKDFFDFCDRADGRAISKSTLDAMVKGGAFDSLHGVQSRAALVAAIPEAIRSGQERAKDRQVYVLGRMVSEGFITQEEADQAAAQELVIRPRVYDIVAPVAIGSRVAAESEAASARAMSWVTRKPRARSTSRRRAFCSKQ